MNYRLKKTGFRWELTLGLATIILVLLILNIASHYAMFRLKDSLLTSTFDRLSEAALVIAAKMTDAGEAHLSDDDKDRIAAEYVFTGLEVIHLNYDRALALGRGDITDSVFSSIDSQVTAEEIHPLLLQDDVFIHRDGELISHYLHSLEIDGSTYVLHLQSENRILASLERAGKVLVFFGLVGVGVIIFVSAAFIRKATHPFSRLREKAEKTGHFNANNVDEIDELINSYEKIIADLKSNEAELVRLNARIKSRADELEAHNAYILRSIATGIMTLDNEGRVSSANQAICRILGFDAAQSGGKLYGEVMNRYPEICSYIGTYLTDQKPLNNQGMAISAPDGVRRILAISITGLSDAQNNKIGMSILINDMTELDRLQKEVEAKNSMALLGEMSGGLAHQLRNSMAAIVGLGKLIVKKAGADHPAGQNAALVLKEALEAETLVSRFLDFARPLAINNEIFDISGMLSNLIDSYEHKYSNINYYFKSDAGRILINGDSLLLKQAVSNIIDNASRACGDRGEVKINLVIDGKSLRVEIYDTGPGISDDVGDKVFAPFYSTSPSGTGLGLPLARKIVLLHEGFLGYDRRPEGGTVFTITLPLSQPGPVEAGLLSADKFIAS